MQKIIITVLSIVALALVLFVFMSHTQTPEGKTKVIVAKQTLFVDTAETEKEQAQGLSGRETLSENEGMLFVYQEEDIRFFWMKDMNFSIDIIWIDGNKRIVDITKNASPESYPEIFSPKKPAQYVLEVVAGFSDKHNLEKGDMLLF